MIRTAVRGLIVQRGWQPGSDLEDRAARLLSGAFSSSEVNQQQKVGPYWLDFSWPDVMVALEVDGFRHIYDPVTARKDAERDSYLRGQGWLVLRVDDTSLEDSVVRVCEVVHSLRLNRRRS